VFNFAAVDVVIISTVAAAISSVLAVKLSKHSNISIKIKYRKASRWT